MNRFSSNVVLLALAASCMLALCACNDSPKPDPALKAAAQAPQIPADIQSAAETALGSEAEVLLFGDLALDGQRQLLAVNRIKNTPQTMIPGTLVSRVALLEDDGGTWKELFRCDEHLKNTSGFLGGTPLAGVSGWRLQFEQDPQKGLSMYFTPMAKPTGGYVQTIGVRWNPEVKRYQSLDRTYTQFLGEVKQLEPPMSQIR
jgi:hypothetical protein